MIQFEDWKQSYQNSPWTLPPLWRSFFPQRIMVAGYHNRWAWRLAPDWCFIAFRLHLRVPDKHGFYGSDANGAAWAWPWRWYRSYFDTLNA